MSRSTERDGLPTSDDVHFYREHGWYISPRIFTDEALDELARGVERHYAGERDMPLPVAINRAADWQEGRSERLRVNDYIALVNKQLSTILKHQILAETAARLAGSSQVRLFQSGIVSKEPGTGQDATVGWHTDRAYWQTCTSDNMLTAWIPLHDVNESMGSLTMLDGSHLWKPTGPVDDLRLGRTFVGSDADSLQAQLESTGMPLKPIPIELERGQVSFHHCMILHGSGPNRSDRLRTAITVHLQDRSNQYRRVTDVAGDELHHGNDMLCRKLPNGDPDYSDPSFCPVLWEEGDDERPAQTDGLISY